MYDSLYCNHEGCHEGCHGGPPIGSHVVFEKQRRFVILILLSIGREGKAKGSKEGFAAHNLKLHF